MKFSQSTLFLTTTHHDHVTDEQLALGIYELMIKRGMTYDENPDNGIFNLDGI